jgi:hypothetical protein
MRHASTHPAVTLQFALSDLDQEKEPLIRADVVSLICADLRTEAALTNGSFSSQDELNHRTAHFG